MALPRELVDQRQPTKRAAAVIAVLHEVPAPHVVRTRRTTAIDAVRRHAKTPLSPLLSRHAKALPVAHSVHPLVVHTPPVQTKTAAHHPLAVPRISTHDLVDPTDQRRLFGRDATHVTLPKTKDAADAAQAPNRSDAANYPSVPGCGSQPSSARGACGCPR
jgi:hypothetical protein